MLSTLGLVDSAVQGRCHPACALDQWPIMLGEKDARLQRGGHLSLRLQASALALLADRFLWHCLRHQGCLQAEQQCHRGLGGGSEG